MQIPNELLQAISNPQGPQNVLEMFARGQEQARQNEEWGHKRRTYNALLDIGPAIEKGDYRKAASVMGGVGDSAAARDYITMAEQQERNQRLKGLIEPQLGIGGAGYVQGPPAGGYRGPIGGDNQPRVPQMPKSMTRMGTQPSGNVALARALYAAGDLEGAIKELYRDRATPDMVEYQLAQQQGYTGTFRQYQLELKRAGANSTSVTVAGETEYAKTRGKGFAETANAIDADERAAFKTLNSLNAMEKQIASPSFYSGAGASQVQTLKRYAAAIGIDPKGVTSMETFNSLSKQAALDVMGGSLGTGFSNADRDFVIDQVPNLANTPEGNRALIQVHRAIQERKIEIARMARDYEQENGRLDNGFMEQLSVWAEENPLFAQNSDSDSADAPADQQLRRGQTATNPQTGERLLWDGQQWRPFQ